MTTLAQSIRRLNKPWQWIAIGMGIVFIWTAVSIPGLYRSRTTADQASQAFVNYGAARQETKVASASTAESADAKVATQGAAIGKPTPDRKLVRTSSLDIVVQHPSETAQIITALADKFGGYVETANSGGRSANSASLTIRVPATQFVQARAEIGKLGLRVESEKVDAQDVTRQYVDQDARIRNLRAEEAGYLAILRQATTVKDMLAVSERLSEVRGQIELQQAEFNALSKQIETVSIAISLRTESEPQLFGLNWRPVAQLKLAAHDGLESLATYATAMTTILFFLPAVVLWAGTLLLAIIAAWWIVRTVNSRWFAAKATDASAQNQE